MNDKRMQYWKSEYENIPIPTELDKVIAKATSEGKKSYSKKNEASKFSKSLIGIAAAFSLFVVAINSVPTFAAELQKVPFIGTLVKTLTFTQVGSDSGGQRADNIDIDSITIPAKDSTNAAEELIINFSQNGSVPEHASSFHVSYSEYPSTLHFSVGGVRRFSAEKDFDEIRKSKYVKDIYKIMTLDDSLQNFAISFTEPVKLQIEEFSNPAKIIVHITPLGNTEKAGKYFIRTASFPNGEPIGQLDEKLFKEKSKRIIKDVQGDYFIDIAGYSSLEEAQEALTLLKAKYGADVVFHIENREPLTTPQSIPN